MCRNSVCSNICNISNVVQRQEIDYADRAQQKCCYEHTVLQLVLVQNVFGFGNKASQNDDKRKRETNSVLLGLQTGAAFPVCMSSTTKVAACFIL